MTDETVTQALLPVTQADRDEAAKFLRGVYGEHAFDSLWAPTIERGAADWHAIVRLVAAVRQSHSLPGVERLADWRETIIHPNNRLLFRRMAEVAGIDIGTDDIATALRKVAALTPSALSGEVGTNHRADMANVGEALMEAIRDYGSHSFMKGWHPADCPTEIVGDLLNALDEADGWRTVAGLPMWWAGIVTDGEHVAFAQKAEADFDGYYWAVDPEDALEWEPTHCIAAPGNALSAHQGEVERVSAIDDIAAERRRQVEAEGWTPDHDDEHGDGSLAAAAATYAFSAATADRFLAHDPIGFWPWAAEWWKPSTPRRDLVKAGALIVAEIERIDRAALAQPEGETK